MICPFGDRSHFFVACDMTIEFDRPIGTPADLKELEYLSALHQTCFPKLRQDASIDCELFVVNS